MPVTCIVQTLFKKISYLDFVLIKLPENNAYDNDYMILGN